MFDPGQVNWGLFGLWYVVFLLSLTVHEGAHALFALLGGDDTAFRGGQVSLSPLPHVRREPLGTVLFPALSFLAFGWVMGWASTPYDPYWAERHPRRAALMALAGPGGNLLLLVLGLVVAKVLLAADLLEAPRTVRFHQVVQAAGGGSGIAAGLATALGMLMVLNLFLAAFNLIPLPPLDGSGILAGLLTGRAAEAYRDFCAAPAVRLLGMLAAWYGVARVLPLLFSGLLRLLYPGLTYR